MLTSCAHCHRRFIVADQSIGRAARCTFCNERFLIEPHFSEEINIPGDEEDIARSLNLPTLEDIEDCLLSPDVDTTTRDKAPKPVVLPPVNPPIPDIEYLEGRHTTASLLLLVFAGAVLAYGLWLGGKEPALAAAAREQFGIEVPTDNWSRIWQPLLSKAALMLVAVGPIFWAGAYLAARLLRLRYLTSGFMESLAIVSVPMSLPMLAVVAFGTDDPRVVIPATVAGFPAVCLLVPALFGMPLAKGVTTAAICIAVAAPAFIGISLWSLSIEDSAITLDDARLTRSIERKKQQLAEAATQPAETGAMAIARSLAQQISPEIALQTHPSSQPAAQLSPQPSAAPAPQGMGEVPAIPPGVSVTARVASLPDVLPAEPRKAPSPEVKQSVPLPQPEAPAAPVVALPQPPAPDVKSLPTHLSTWRQAGSPHQLIWPATAGSTFATIRIDPFSNHILEFWQTDSLERRGTLRLGGGSQTSYAICPAGETLLRVVNGASPAAELWSLSDGGRRLQIPLPAELSEARALGFFDKQTFGLLVRQGTDAAVDILDAERGTFRRRIPWQVLASSSGSAGGECTPENVAVSPDGKLLAFVDSPTRLRLVDVASGAVKRSWQLNLPRPESADVTAISFSPDGSLIALMFDESHSANRAAIFCGPVQSMELASISFAEPIWKQAGCPRKAGARVGRALDWVGRHELLVYGELVLDASSGSVIASVHDRSTPPAEAAYSQYPLADGSFLLQSFPDAQQKRPPIQRLQLETLLSSHQR